MFLVTLSRCKSGHHSLCAGGEIVESIVGPVDRAEGFFGLDGIQRHRDVEQLRRAYLAHLTRSERAAAVTDAREIAGD